MKNLSSRFFSAVIALLILFAAIYFGQDKGIYVICLLVVLRGSFEMARMFFTADYPPFAIKFFLFIATLVFLLITPESLHFISGVSMIISFIVIASVGILFNKSFKSPEMILTFISKCSMGLIYACFLPATVVWMVQSNNGVEWFLCLLAVVFAGDIGAFIFGSRFGTIKLAPTLSPNKSLQGSIGGLVFSVLIAAAFQFVLPNTPLSVLLFCGLGGGLLGQIGDFFESLIKRVSGVKDSGTIMPGHGGVLDRLDGVLIAAPLFYIAATYFSL